MTTTTPITTPTITAGVLDTALVTFLGAFLSDIVLTGAHYLGAAEVAGLAALGVFGYHYISGNTSA